MRKRQEEIFGSLTREQRARVSRAVYGGRVLADPEEAAAAVRLARFLLRRRRKTGWRRAGSLLAAIITVLYLASSLVLFLRREIGTVPSWPTVLLSFYLFVHLYSWSSAPRRYRQIAQAERLNLQLVEASGLSVELEKPDGVDTSWRVRSDGLTPRRVPK
jgi:hypothetical protein